MSNITTTTLTQDAPASCDLSFGTKRSQVQILSPRLDGKRGYVDSINGGIVAGPLGGPRPVIGRIALKQALRRPSRQVIFKPILGHLPDLPVPKDIEGLPGLTEIPVPPPRQSGIYFLCNGNTVIYIGQSVAVHARIDGHVAENTKLFNRAFFVPCRERDLDEMERKYINMYLPPYNCDPQTQYFRRRIREIASYHRNAADLPYPLPASVESDASSPFPTPSGAETEAANV